MAWMTPEETRKAAEKEIRSAFERISALTSRNDVEKKLLADAQGHLSRATDALRAYKATRGGAL